MKLVYRIILEYVVIKECRVLMRLQNTKKKQLNEFSTIPLPSFPDDEQNGLAA
jgi:hypothetical protein